MGRLEAAAVSVEVSEAVESEGARRAVVVTESETEGSRLGVSSAEDGSIGSVEVVLAGGGAVNMESEVVGSRVGSREEDSDRMTSLVGCSMPIVDDVSVLIAGRS